MTAHARLGCSNHRWPHCAGSIREEAGYEDTAGDAAIDGTGSHLLLELCINEQKDASEFLGQTIGEGDKEKPEGWFVEKDRVDRVQMCLNYISRRIAELKAQFPEGKIVIEAERKADPGGLYGRDDWWGTCDVTISVFGTEKPGLLFLEVCDYKDGRGWVSEKDNSQLQSYLAGQMRPYIGSGPEFVRPFRTERIGGTRQSIVQPKTSPPIRYVDHRPDEVMVAVDRLSIAAFATDKEDAPLTPGKHCQWCKANPKRGGHCTAAAEQSLTVVKNMSTDLETNGSLFENIGQVVADVTTMASDQLSQLADAKPALLAAFERVEKEIQARLERGDKVTGYDMLPSRSSYVWNKDTATIEKMLKGKRWKNDQIYPKKIISVNQMRKSTDLTPEQKKRIEKDYVSEKVGKVTMQKVALREKESSKELFADVPPPSFL